MSIQEQIQILEDNLNEYGQCNITIEEYNFLIDEIYSSGCLAGIELGRAEAIDECIKIVGDNSCMYSCDEDDCVECTIKRMEQLKEQNR